MLTRIEIDGFKSFVGFGLDLRPLTAIVGPNASGKSNLFDAIQLISALAQTDIRSAMKGLRGEPEEFFRQTADGVCECMTLAVEVYLDRRGVDAFGRSYEIPAQRLRYELRLGLSDGNDGSPPGIYVRNEFCRALRRAEDTASFLQPLRPSYNSTVRPLIKVNESGDAVQVRQDGRQKHGRPVQFPLKEAPRTALSTIATAEFPHLYALKEMLTDLRFLEINPIAARGVNDRFEATVLKPDASNLSAVLARLKAETGTQDRPDGVLADIAADLTALIPSVMRLHTGMDATQRQYSFSIDFAGDLRFSSRVISDGTLRLLALLTVLNDPERRGTLCFEEPENGVHEGRIALLVTFLRDAAAIDPANDRPPFQVLLATHSPKVMQELMNTEIIAADTVSSIDPETRSRVMRTRMRGGIVDSGDLIDPGRHLVRAEVEQLLRHPVDAA